MKTTGLDPEFLEMTLQPPELRGAELPVTASSARTSRRVPDGRIRAICDPRPARASSSSSCAEEYGGLRRRGVGLLPDLRGMARIDLGVATGVFATFLGSDPIHFGGTEEQKRRWLGRIAEEGILFAYGATEPAAGSDLGALRTTATPVVEDGRVTGYRLNGAKQWISNGGFADVYTILANAPGGTDLVRPREGAPRGSHGKPEDKHGIRPRNTAALSLVGRLRPGREPRRRRRGPGPDPGAARLRLHPAHGGRVRARRRVGGARPGDPLLEGADPGGEPPLREAGLHAQADRPPRREARGGAGLRRGDGRAPRRRARARSTRRGRSPSTSRPRRATPPPTPRSRRSAATATRASTRSRSSGGTSGSRRSTRGRRRSWR